MEKGKVATEVSCLQPCEGAHPVSLGHCEGPGPTAELWLVLFVQLGGC